MNDHKKIALGCLVVVLLCFALTASAGAIYKAIADGTILFPAGVSPNDETARRDEYYRGAYDVCQYFYENTGGDPSQTIATCNKFTQRLRDSSWYEAESKGYEP